MNISYEEVKQYVADIKAAVQAGWYRIVKNRKRQANTDLYRDYVIDEEKTRNILLDLTAEDFCERSEVAAEIWDGSRDRSVIYKV